MRKQKICVAVAGTLVVGGLSTSPQVYAESGNLALEEIMVTAQKVRQNLQEVPISIQSFDAKALEKSGIDSIMDLGALVPGLKFSPYPTSQETLMVTLRGISANGVELTQDSPVAVHVNGIYMPRGNGLNMSVVDLERVEVLKGPQGALYGRNATAGAINLITAKPYDEFGFTQQITVGNYGRLLSKTSVNLPVSDMLAVKLAYLNDSSDGFIKNGNGGNSLGLRRAEGFRLDARLKVSENITVDYGYDTATTKYNSIPNQCFDQINQWGGKVIYGGATLAVLPSGPYAPNAIPVGQCNTSRLETLYSPLSGRVYAPPLNSVRNEGHALIIEWKPSPDHTIRSLTSYREMDDHLYGALNTASTSFLGAYGLAMGATTSMAPGDDHSRDKSTSQEFQFVGRIDKSLSYTAGLYFFDEKGSEFLPTSPMYGFTLNGGVSWSGGTNGLRDVSTHNKSSAAFGQLTWTPDVLGGKFDIIPGLRYTSDKREARMLLLNGPSWSYNSATGAETLGVATIKINDQYSDSSSKATPSLTLQYHLTANQMIYGKYSEGYKAGGTATRASSPAAFVMGFKPETLKSTELGFKGEFMDRRLRLNADVFQSKYTDRQLAVYNVAGTTAITSDILNAGKSTYKGLEMETSAAITNALRVGLNWTRLDFKFDQVLSNGNDVTPYYHMKVPKDSYSITFDYAFGKVGLGNLDLHLDYSHVDAQSLTIYNDNFNAAGVLTPLAGQPSAIYDASRFMLDPADLVNGRISWSNINVGPSNNGSLTIALWGKNLSDKKYIASSNVGGSIFSGRNVLWGPPRTLGVDVIYRY